MVCKISQIGLFYRLDRLPLPMFQINPDFLKELALVLNFMFFCHNQETDACCLRSKECRAVSVFGHDDLLQIDPKSTAMCPGTAPGPGTNLPPAATEQ